MTSFQPSSINRRELLSLAAGAAFAGATGVPAYAAATHRFAHGDFDISVFSDGFLTLSADILLPTPHLKFVLRSSRPWAATWRAHRFKPTFRSFATATT